ncbi:Glutamate--cysteine ligase [Erysiphe neolycopersici]|uniref:Glutamate--cysteine ligase n=1 Tax=Erysiphe neolycopersici TaxID=212602 RepID=A0A420HYX9_9PEZI|nr:Glutamate--cysteine ligase [Erysiphe neolycopersici]
MGLLALGTPLEWPEAQAKADLVREWGVQQLLTIWNKAKSKERDVLLWGDEIEYLVVNYKADEPTVTLSLRQAEILETLAESKKLRKYDGNDETLSTSQQSDSNTDIAPAPNFHPEFGRFMLESTPGKPWGISFKHLLEVESSMKLRRSIAKAHMLPEEYPITLTTFPRLGTPGEFIRPYYPNSGERLRSQFVPDQIANPHIRFPTLAANIRSRRGRKVQVNVPVFRDKNTKWPWRDPTVNFDLHNWPEDNDVRNGAVLENYIHMDAMAFGMGSCCLQITFQAKNIQEGRLLYDQLSPLGPILLALTAATPIYKGFLADTDARWNQISASVDDRTLEELGKKPLKSNRWRIPKSRYASNSTYISDDPRLRPEYLDPDLVFVPEIKESLMDGGMDSLLATHFAHLFIRDPIVIFNEDIQELDLDKTDHFENFQSTNWQHIRFKPPPADNSIGWRVEFRSMEIQITDFENAAFAVFIVLLTRVILSFNLNFYIPIRKTDDNMQTAQKRDAVTKEKFYFRKNPFNTKYTSFGSTSEINSSHNTPQPSATLPPIEDEYTLMDIDTIINGSNNTQSDWSFPGLIPLIESYLDSMNIDIETHCKLASYLDLIRNRASGKLWTAAKWIREFVNAHEEYQADSQISDKINYDLIQSVIALGTGNRDGILHIENFLQQ